MRSSHQHKQFGFSKQSDSDALNFRAYTHRGFLIQILRWSVEEKKEKKREVV
jgi:hypothetical protein